MVRTSAPLNEPQGKITDVFVGNKSLSRLNIEQCRTFELLNVYMRDGQVSRTHEEINCATVFMFTSRLGFASIPVLKLLC